MKPLEGASGDPLRDFVRDDPAVARFLADESAEREASDHTVRAYARDLGQFAEFFWRRDRTPPYPWGEVRRNDVRAWFAATGFPSAALGEWLGSMRDATPATVVMEKTRPRFARKSPPPRTAWRLTGSRWNNARKSAPVVGALFIEKTAGTLRIPR